MTHRTCTVFVDASTKVLATGYDPVETCGDRRPTRGDVASGVEH